MPTATPQRLTGMVAVSKDSKVKPLGYVCWFSVPDESVKLSRLRRIWQLAGLDPKPLPKDQRAVNAFKRAVREQEKLGTFTDSATGLRVETDVRDVLENAEDVIYQITRVVRDKDNRAVEYPKALQVWYSKVKDEIDFKVIVPKGVDPKAANLTRQALLGVMESVQELFDANTKAVTGAKVRTLVRSYVKNDEDETLGSVGLSGENLRGKAGGVYFVLAKHADKLESLADFLDELYEPQGRAYLYTVPMADGATEREMIRRAHVANTVAEMDEEMEAVRQLLRDGRDREVRSNVKSHHWNRLQALRRRAAEYAEALKDEQEDLTTRLDVLHNQLRKLV
jgi:hypothetical protein